MYMYMYISSTLCFYCILRMPSALSTRSHILKPAQNMSRFFLSCGPRTAINYLTA